MIRFITEHWELKLVAMVIAIALWLYTNGQVRVEKTITVQVPAAAVQSLPDDYRVTAIQPKGFTVKVSVPESVLHNLKTQGVVPKLVIGADALASGTQAFVITSGLLGLDNDIRIERVEPETVKEIRVTFARVTEDTLPVEVPRLIGVPDGIESTVALDRTRVHVRGTRAQLEALHQGKEKVSFDPITLDDIDPQLQQPRQEVIKLTPRSDRLEVTEPEQVTATVTLKPIAGSRQVVSLPVHVLVARDFSARFQLELSQPQVAMTVHGPENLLRTMHPESDLTAYINLRHNPEPNLAQEVPVNLLAPVWLTYDPASVRVTANLIQAKPATELHAPAPPSEGTR